MSKAKQLTARVRAQFVLNSIAYLPNQLIRADKNIIEFLEGDDKVCSKQKSINYCKNKLKAKVLDHNSIRDNANSIDSEGELEGDTEGELEGDTEGELEGGSKTE